MEYDELAAKLLEKVATGNHQVSDMLHTSKDFGKCKHLSKTRGNMYNGRIVKIDLSATSQDHFLDLSSLASYKAFICLRGVRGRFCFCWHVGCGATP